VGDALPVIDAVRFEAFVREYQDMVYAVAIRLLANPAEAEDVSQTVFLKAYERFDEIAASPAIAGWLKTVTTNLCLNHLSRYRSRWRLFSELPREGADGADRLQRMAASATSAGVDVERAEEHERLERELRRLPDHQRVPLVLFHFEDKSYQDIAALLGVSLAKVKTDIHRGRDALRKVLSSGHGSA
jgi:RNA polymerase sigma-70 factor (ECF subfamily)